MANPWKKPDANRSIVIYVPTTYFEKTAPKRVVSERVKETVIFLEKLFGGTTRVIGQGTWLDKNKRFDEMVIMVETMTTDKDIEKNKQALRRWVSSKRKKWKQHSISVKYEEDMSWVKK